MANFENTEAFDPDFLEHLRGLTVRLQQRKKMRQRGGQLSPSSGFTREFKDFRSYSRRDDYREIDWNLFARLDRLFIRLYEEVQEFHVHVLCDDSLSMAEPMPEKAVLVQKLSLAFGLAALVGNHRLSVYRVTDSIEPVVSSIKGQGSFQRLIEGVKSLRFEGQTNCQSAFSDFVPTRRRYGVVFILTDGFGASLSDLTNALTPISNWYAENHLIQILAASEGQLDSSSDLRFEEVETKRSLTLQISPEDSSLYEKMFEEFCDELSDSCTAKGVAYQRWRTSDEFDRLLLQVLSKGVSLQGDM